MFARCLVEFSNLARVFESRFRSRWEASLAISLADAKLVIQCRLRTNRGVTRTYYEKEVHLGVGVFFSRLPLTLAGLRTTLGDGYE